MFNKNYKIKVLPPQQLVFFLKQIFQLYQFAKSESALQ